MLISPYHLLSVTFVKGIPYVDQEKKPKVLCHPNTSPIILEYDERHLRCLLQDHIKVDSVVLRGQKNQVTA